MWCVCVCVCGVCVWGGGGYVCCVCVWAGVGMSGICVSQGITEATCSNYQFTITMKTEHTKTRKVVL